MQLEVMDCHVSFGRSLFLSGTPLCDEMEEVAANLLEAQTTARKMLGSSQSSDIALPE